MPKKYPRPTEEQDQPKSPQVNTAQRQLVGKLTLYHSLKKQIKELSEQADEYRLSLIDLIKSKVPVDVDGSHRYVDEDAGIEATLQIQKRENFSVQSAMDLLNTLDEDVARKYIIETTNKDQISSAFLQQAITESQLKTVFTEKDVEVLTVKDLK